MEQLVLPTQVQTRFVQLYASGKPYLICQPEEEHSVVLANALVELGINFRSRWGMPAVSGDGYELVGDGFCGKNGNEYKLGGKSGHFKLGPNRKHLEELTPAMPGGVAITIDDTL